MKEFLVKQYPRSRERISRPVFAAVSRYEHQDVSVWHQHSYGQLAFSIRGVVRMLTPTRTWTLPPSRAIWLPSYVDHELHAVGRSELCNVYIEPEVFPWSWSKPTIITITPLLRELAILVSEGGEAYSPDSRAERAASLLLEVLAEQPALPESGIPLPRDERLLEICSRSLANPASNQSLDVWGEKFGATGRTLANRFREETGLTFGLWQRQLRVAEAITRLANGQTVTKVAADLGYSTSSAFIAMFRQATGDSPQHYLEPR
ncbi:AraC family transcriptional regulator [Pararobbsia silviterrae]|uniref:AraC family transcriptional regulator n=1 Tax=Pararobbsia silviterrae TaxID=1792498 RepID=A0A494XHN5_9BURK|nr:helix-turn-helix transcriptional regulator [Pararobbsia silviterrae]RKP47679.1 AraC family transcriptional regulator [Pararobbsia silviterrae]